MGQAMGLQRRPCTPIFPEDIMFEIISRLSVKHIMRLRCVNKFFNTLIFDPHFVQMHLNKSSQNSQLALTHSENTWNSSLITVSIPDVLQNKSNIIHNVRLSKFFHVWQCVVGSCNGLLCLFGISYPSQDSWLCFWNPVMKTKSQTFAMFFDPFPKRHLNFSFGYDNLTQTYKVVVFYVEVKTGCNPRSVVRVFSLRDNSWRVIQCFPVLPLYWFHRDKNNGVHLNGTINWIAFRDHINSNIIVDRYVILSLDLSTETYTQLLLPAQRFDKVSRYQPKIVVLMDCLCFYHDFEETHFVIWQMKDFGVQESWIQLFKISYENCFGLMNLLPLYLSENDGTLILARDEYNEAFIYNRRDNIFERIGRSNLIKWSQAKDYVESLVSIH